MEETNCPNPTCNIERINGNLNNPCSITPPTIIAFTIVGHNDAIIKYPFLFFICFPVKYNL